MEPTPVKEIIEFDAEEYKAYWLKNKVEDLFFQIYVQDVINDGFGDGPIKEDIETIYKNIRATVAMFYDVQEEMQKA